MRVNQSLIMPLNKIHHYELTNHKKTIDLE